ncbi:hypothetical protein [Massilia sp. CCM 8734]|uniref:hypothetical protein n=1 Tax=Massilia sp. CCM 8734 TaxID=2609283 RepID=UPI001420810D|nr:hypothetical protein [Massilia sp. CCM 8734]NHZ95886.1 hypothetical protein [Massilia sp. CCM 8734]
MMRWLRTKLSRQLAPPSAAPVFSPAEPGAGLARDPRMPVRTRRYGPVPSVGDTVLLTDEPRFALCGDWLVAPRPDGGSVLHAVANSVLGQPGKQRRYRATPHLAELGVVLFGKVLARVVSNGAQLTFVRFPGMDCGQPRSVPLPPAQQFRAPSDQGRWLPTFFLIDHSPTGAGARVLMLDQERKLVCWTAYGHKQGAGMRFDEVADQVVGASQTRKLLIYARSDGQRTTIHTLAAKAQQPTMIAPFDVDATQVLFGHAHLPWLYAMRIDDTTWQMVDHNARLPIRIRIAEGARVIAVLHGGLLMGRRQAASLLVIGAQRRTLELHWNDQNRVLVRSDVPIAQAVLDASGRRLCWLTDRNALSVIDLSGGGTLLAVAPAPDREAV